METSDIISLAVAIVLGIAAIYREQTIQIIKKVPAWISQWANWMDKKQPVVIGPFSTSIAPIDIMVRTYSLLIVALIILFAVLFVLAILSNVFKGHSPEKMLLDSSVMALMVILLYKVRKFKK